MRSRRGTKSYLALGARASFALALGLIVSIANFAAAEDRPELILQAGHTRVVRSVAFSGDGRWMASGGDDSTVNLWDIGSGRLFRTISTETDGVWQVALDRRGETLVTLGLSGPLSVWDTRTGRKVGIVKIDVSEGNAAFDADLRWVAFNTANHEVRIVAIPTGAELAAVEGTGTSAKVAASANGRWLATVTDHSPMLWDMKSKRPSTLRFPKEELGIEALALSADGALMAASSGAWISKTRNVKLWDARTGRLIYQLTEQTDAVYGIALSPDGRLLATGDFSGAVKLWDVASGRKLHEMKDAKGSVNRLQFSADGRKLALGSGRSLQWRRGFGEDPGRRYMEGGPSSQ